MMSEASFASLGPTLLARKGGAKPAMRPQLTPLPENLSEIAAIAEEQLEDLGWNDMGADSEGEDLAPNAETSAAALSADAIPLLSAKPISKATPEAHTTDPALFAAECEDEGGEDEYEAGPHPIIDPLASADIVPFGMHPTSRAPANEDTLDTNSPVIINQQKRLARRILADAASDQASGAFDETTKAALQESDNPSELLRQKPSKAADISEPITPAKPRARRAKRTPSKSEAAKQSAARRAAFTLRLDTERHLKLRLAATMHGVSAQSLVTEALDALLNDIDDLDTLVDRLNRSGPKPN